MPSTAQVAAGAAAIAVAYTVLELVWPDLAASSRWWTFIFPALRLVYVPLCALVAMRARPVASGLVLMTIGLASWALGEFVCLRRTPCR